MLVDALHRRSWSAPDHSGSGGGASQRGFTLIELIMVMVMLGVLAVFAAPRIFNSGDFYARGFHDETLGLLRYAQKAAILSVINTVVKSSADPMVRKQTMAIAESMLEEILLKDYANPTGGYTGAV